MQSPARALDARRGRARKWRAPVRFAAITVFLGLALPIIASAQQPPAAPTRLTLEEALELARLNNPGYLASINDPDLTDWDVRAAYSQFFPSVSAGGGVSWQGAGQQLVGGLTQSQLGIGNQPSYYFSRYNVGISHQLSGSTLLGPARARADRDITVAQVDAARVSLDANVTRAYLEVLRQQEQVTLTQQQLERVRFDLRMATGRAEVGQGTQLDVMQAELQVGRSEVARLQAENGLETARLRLLQQIGSEATPGRELSLTTTFQLEEPRWEHAELHALALERNPVLRSRRSAVEASAVGLRIARTAYYPTVSLSWGISGFTRQASSTDFLVGQARSQIASQVANCEFQNNLYSRLADPLPAQDCTRFRFTDDLHRSVLESNQAFPFDFTRQPASASLTVSIPVFQGLDRERQVEAARLQRADANHQVREQEIALTADLAIGLAAVRTAYQSALLEQRNQTFADEQLRLARERYQLGAITFIDLVEAETVKAQADRLRLNAIFAYHDAVTSLESVAGTPLR